ncbi:hypothetical protein EV360DRAFT_83750 [Lentinula raphanica]|nr:hypothetical protein EV360DRAFT_83750 [Lentinula raphanica]
MAQLLASTTIKLYQASNSNLVPSFNLILMSPYEFPFGAPIDLHCAGYAAEFPHQKLTLWNMDGYKPLRLRPFPSRAGLLPPLPTTNDFKTLCTRYAQHPRMVYTRSMFTTLLAFGAASFVVVSAVPIDTNSGPSPTSTLTSDSHTPTSTSLSAAAASSTLLDLSGVAPLSQPAGDLLPEASSICTLSVISSQNDFDFLSLAPSTSDNDNGGNGGGQDAQRQPAVNGRTPSSTGLDHPPNHDRGYGSGPTEPYDVPPSSVGKVGWRAFRSPTGNLGRSRSRKFDLTF